MCRALRRALHGSMRSGPCPARVMELRTANSSTMRTHEGRESHRLRHIQRLAGPHRACQKMIPTAKIFNRHIKAIRNRNQRIAPAHGVSLRVPGRSDKRHRNNQLIPFSDRLARLQAIHFADIARMRMKTGRNAVERLAGARHMESPAVTLLFGDVLQPLGKDLFRADRDMQIEREVARRAHTKQAWIQRNNLRQRGIRHLRDQPHIERIVHIHRVPHHRRFGHHFIQPILHRILCHDDRGQDLRHIVLGLLRHHVAPIELPEVRIARAHHCSLHIPRAPVVARHREVPVAELAVERLHILGIGDRRLLRIKTLIHIPIARQAISARRHELPHPTRATLRVQRLRLKARLRHRQVEQVLRQPLVRERFLDNRLVPPRTLQAMHHVGAERWRVREVANIPRHLIVDHQRQVRLRLQLRLQLRRQLRVRRERQVLGVLERRLFELWRKSIPLLQRHHLERVHGVQQVVELIRELRVVLQIHPAHQHHVDRRIKVDPRRIQPISAVVVHAAAITGLRLVDQRLRLVCIRSRSRRLRLNGCSGSDGFRRRRRRRCRCCSSCGSGSLGRNLSRSHRLIVRASRQQQQRRARYEKCTPPNRINQSHPRPSSPFIVRRLGAQCVRKTLQHPGETKRVY